MSASIRISRKAALFLQALVADKEKTGDWRSEGQRHVDELRAALSKSKRLTERKRPALKAKAAAKKTKAQRGRDLKTALIERSDASCELCGHATCMSQRRFDTHHALGRKGLVDGEHNCLFLCEFCHGAVTNPGDDAPGWFMRQALVFRGLGHRHTATELEKKADFAQAKINARAALSQQREAP